MVKGSDVNRLLLHVRSCVPVTESAWSCCSYLGHCASQTVSWPSCSVLVCLLAAETWTTSYSLRFRPHLEVWAGPCWCVLPWPPWSKLILCDISAEDLRQTALYSFHSLSMESSFDSGPSKVMALEAHISSWSTSERFLGCRPRQPCRTANSLLMLKIN